MVAFDLKKWHILKIWHAILLGSNSMLLRASFNFLCVWPCVIIFNEMEIFRFFLPTIFMTFCYLRRLFWSIIYGPMSVFHDLNVFKEVVQLLDKLPLFNSKFYHEFDGVDIFCQKLTLLA